MCQSLLDPQAPLSNPGHLKPARLYRQLVVLTGAGRACLSVCPQEMVSGQPFNCSSFTPRSFTPAEEGTNQHQPALGPPLQFSFLQLLAGAGPSASPGAAKVLPRFSALPPPGTASRPAGGTYLHALCVFLSERRGGR